MNFRWPLTTSALIFYTDNIITLIQFINHNKPKLISEEWIEIISFLHQTILIKINVVLQCTASYDFYFLKALSTQKKEETYDLWMKSTNKKKI